MKYEAVTLEKVEQILDYRISANLLKFKGIDLKIKLELDYVADEISCKIINSVTSQSIEKVEIKYPKDWIQAFKERWFPKFLLNRYPIIYTKKTIDIRALYPRVILRGKTEYHIKPIEYTEEVKLCERMNNV